MRFPPPSPPVECNAPILWAPGPRSPPALLHRLRLNRLNRSPLPCRPASIKRKVDPVLPRWSWRRRGGVMPLKNPEVSIHRSTYWKKLFRDNVVRASSLQYLEVKREELTTGACGARVIIATIAGGIRIDNRGIGSSWFIHLVPRTLRKLLKEHNRVLILSRIRRVNIEIKIKHLLLISPGSFQSWILFRFSYHAPSQSIQFNI